MSVDFLSSGDRVELLELYARSVMLLDLGRCADWVNLFCINATVRCGGGRSGIRDFKGRDELWVLGRRLMEGAFDVALGSVMPSLRVRHLLSNVTLFGDGHWGALGYAHLTVASVGGSEPPRWLASGVYSDRFKKCATGWQFESRTLTTDGG